MGFDESTKDSHVKSSPMQGSVDQSVYLPDTAPAVNLRMLVWSALVGIKIYML